MKFLFDLFPVILFFITYKLTSHGEKGAACLVSSNHNVSLLQEPILIATAVAIAAAFLQVGWLLIRGHKVEKMLWASLGIILVLGSATLYFRNPTFIQWKPTLLYWLIGAFMAFSTLALKKNPIRQVMEEQISLPDTVWGKLNFAWIVFFIVAGAANLLAMHFLDCDGWVSFKVYGLIGLMFIFAIGQALALSRYVGEN